LKNAIKVNSGRIKLTKYDPITGALSTDPKDIRVCTETVQEIQKRKAVETYELPDGNSDYPMGIYEKGVKYDVSVILSDMSNATLAFLNNVDLDTGSGTMKEIANISVPVVAPYEVALLGNVFGIPNVIDMNNFKWGHVSTDPKINEFKVTAGTLGTKQAMSKTVTAAATVAGEVKVTIKAAGSPALAEGKEIIVDVTASDVNTNALEIRTALQSDRDVAFYFDISGVDAEIKLTRKVIAASEVEIFTFALVDAETIALGETTATAGVATIPAKIVFNAANAGMPIIAEYDFNVDAIENYKEKKTALLPVVLVEIVHETLSSDKTKKYRNNTILKKMQYTGSFDETLKREHSPETLAFTAVRPDGVDVAENKKVEIAAIVTP